MYQFLCFWDRLTVCESSTLGLMPPNPMFFKAQLLVIECHCIRIMHTCTFCGECTVVWQWPPNSLTDWRQWSEPFIWGEAPAYTGTGSPWERPVNIYGQDFHDYWKTQLKSWQVTTQTFLRRKAAQPPGHPEALPPFPSPAHHQILLGQLVCPHCHHSSSSSLSCCTDSQLVSPVPHIPHCNFHIAAKKKRKNQTGFYHSLPSNLPVRISTFKLKFKIFSRPCTRMSPPPIFEALCLSLKAQVLV